MAGIRRDTELRRMIKALEGRIEHLADEAGAIEAGSVDTRRKYDADDAYLGRDETSKINFNWAVAYWKEVREAEKRLDDLRAELRALLEADQARPLLVEIVFDGPEAAPEPPEDSGE